MKTFLFVLCLFFCTKSYADIRFVKEVQKQDTCYRFYCVSGFDKKDTSCWFGVMENLYNTYLILPDDENWNAIDEKTKKDNGIVSKCINVIIYYIDGNVNPTVITLENLDNNAKLRKQMILKFNFNNGDLEIDPFKYNIYDKYYKEKYLDAEIFSDTTR